MLLNLYIALSFQRDILYNERGMVFSRYEILGGELFLEKIINTILGMDEKAREMTAKAQQAQSGMAMAIEQRKAELEESYRRSVDEILEMAKQDEVEIEAQEKRKIDERYDALSQRLDTKFSAEHKTWEAQILTRVLGD